MKRTADPPRIALFHGNTIRRIWDEEKELWYFSVVDVISALTNSSNPQVYWRVLKKGLAMKDLTKPLQNVTA